MRLVIETLLLCVVQWIWAFSKFYFSISKQHQIKRDATVRAANRESNFFPTRASLLIDPIESLRQHSALNKIQNFGMNYFGVIWIKCNLDSLGRMMWATFYCRADFASVNSIKETHTFTWKMCVDFCLKSQKSWYSWAPMKTFGPMQVPRNVWIYLKMWPKWNWSQAVDRVCGVLSR